MPLTDEQWRLIEPLLPEPSPFARGRPPFDPRLVMDGVLCKLRFAVPWYDLPDYYQSQPSAAGDQELPSWQTCYRAYRRWGSAGILDQVYKLLYQHLRDQAGLDLFQVLRIAESSAGGGGSAGPMPNFSSQLNQNPGQSSVTLNRVNSRWQLRLSPDLENTWQGSTAHLLARVLLVKMKPRSKLAP